MKYVLHCFIGTGTLRIHIDLSLLVVIWSWPSPLILVKNYKRDKDITITLTVFLIKSRKEHIQSVQVNKNKCFGPAFQWQHPRYFMDFEVLLVDNVIQLWTISHTSSNLHDNFEIYIIFTFKMHCLALFTCTYLKCSIFFLFFCFL